MRVIVFLLPAMIFALAATNAHDGDYPLAIFLAAAGVFLIVAFFIRARRLKRYEQSRKAQTFE
jgi:predicted permease